MEGRGRCGASGKYLASLLLFGLNGIVASQIALPSGQIVWLRTGLGSLLLMGALVLGPAVGIPAVAAGAGSHRPLRHGPGRQLDFFV